MASEVAKSTGQNKLSFTNYMTSKAVTNKVNEILGDEQAGKRFISTIVTSVNSNQALKECDNGSILSGALLGETLNLSPSPQLGQFYLVPFKDKQKGMVAQFIIGFHGYIQLAIRSGQYKKLNVLPIKEGELVKYNPLDEEIEVNLIEDETKREKAKTIGYYAMFEYVNGFKKTLYWSREKMEEHALKYSNGYASDKKNGTKYTFWSKDFDSMACKTMLRQLISKWGIMSTEMQTAYESDMAVINDNGTKTYVDNVQEADVEFVEKTGEVIEPKETKEVKEEVKEYPKETPREEFEEQELFSLDEI